MSALGPGSGPRRGSEADDSATQQPPLRRWWEATAERSRKRALGRAVPEGVRGGAPLRTDIAQQCISAPFVLDGRRDRG